MFKRAIKANHWMAIGLEKWSELEDMDIPLELVRKMRKLRYTASDSEDDNEGEEIVSNSGSLDEDASDSISDDVSDDGSVSDDSDALESEHDHSEGEEETEEVSTSYTLCPICPGRKFLTKKDEEQHMQSRNHLKRSRAAEIPATTPSPKKSIPAKKQKTEEKAKPKTVSNRKARRAHLADSRPQ